MKDKKHIDCTCKSCEKQEKSDIGCGCLTILLLGILTIGLLIAFPAVTLFLIFLIILIKAI